MSNFESSSPMALVPPPQTASRLRKTIRNISYPSPLVLTEERFPLDLIPICDNDDDEETHCGDTLSVTIHLDILSSLHRLMHRVTKQVSARTSSFGPYFASATLFAVFFLLVFAGAAFNSANSVDSLFGRPNIPALRHASNVNANSNARLTDVYSWAAQGGSGEDRYKIRVARAAGIHSPPVPVPVPAQVPAGPSPVAADDRVRPVLSPSGTASAKFRGMRAIVGSGRPHGAVREDKHAHPEDLQSLFAGGRHP